MPKIALPIAIILLAAFILFAGQSFISTSKLPKEKSGYSPEQQIAPPLTPEEALDKVKNLSAVKKYLTQVKSGRVDLNGTEGDAYLIQVYEIKDGHTATFNWYRINKTTGDMTAEFEFTEDLPELSQTYIHSMSGVKFNYPVDWKTNVKTQIFENGDLITVEKLGPTQKPQTDFHDGARFTISLPIETNARLEDYLTDPNPMLKFTTFPLGVNTFAKVDDYYYTKRSNQIYGLFLFAQGEDKDLNEAILQEILASFTFLP